MTDPRAPRSIGVILDGNRRYARARGLPDAVGHRLGFEKATKILEWAGEAGLEHVCFYAFSTENWGRSQDELAHLMDLYEEFCETWGNTIGTRGGRVRFIGELERFRPSLQEKMRAVEARTAGNTKQTAWIALSYGGRAEVLAAVNALLAEKATGTVDEATLRAHMWSAEMPDPDLIIRTGGDLRLSNFLTWQSTYSELFFLTETLPELSKARFMNVLEEFGERARRHGK